MQCRNTPGVWHRRQFYTRLSGSFSRCQYVFVLHDCFFHGHCLVLVCFKLVEGLRCVSWSPFMATDAPFLVLLPSWRLLRLHCGRLVQKHEVVSRDYGIVIPM